jgi:hypothetical protein
MRQALDKRAETCHTEVITRGETMLSNKATNILATAIAQKAADAIFEDERWVDLLQEIIPDVVTKELGEVDDDLLFDLSLTVMDKLVLKAV